MLVLLSPAKKLDFSSPCDLEPTSPALLSRTRQLAKVTKQLSANDLARLMKLSPALAALNHERFQGLSTAALPRGGRPAAHAFDGDTYAGLRAREFDSSDMEFAQERVRILSGLYGVLRPLDSILPHRLEMGTRLGTPRGSNLYEFWGQDIARHLNEAVEALGADLVVNLASQEYFAAVDLSTLSARVITPVFKEEREGRLKIISFSAKRARGMMARHIVKKRIVAPEALKKFREEGYRYSASESDADRWTFVRKQP